MAALRNTSITVGQLQTEGSTPWAESGEGFPILYLPLPNLEGNRQTGLHDAHRATTAFLFVSSALGAG